MPLLFAGVGQMLIGLLMTLIAVFLILLVLVQRGRGGGLSGALGGMGGQSAFGTKAGDTFTKITVVASILWILLCVIAVRVLSPTDNQFGDREAKQIQEPSGSAPPSLGDGESNDPVDPSGNAPTEGSESTNEPATDEPEK